MTTTNEDIIHALHKGLSLFTANITRAYENVYYNPTLQAPYLKAWVLPAETMTATLGEEGLNFYSGIFQIDCVYPKGTGWNAAKTMAGKLCSHFYRGRQITYNNILVKVRQTWPEMGTVADEDEFYRVPVSISYWCFDNTIR